MTRRPLIGVVVTAVLAIIAVGRIAGTYSVYSNTYDEPNHIAAGMEWLERGTFTFEPQHPPLGRVAAAAGPYLAGATIEGAQSFGRAARAVLFSRGAYVKDLTLARMGMLPFFLATVAGVWLWAWRLQGTAAAVIAVALLTTTPLVLAHAGVATTDMPLTGTFTWALLAIVLWLDDQSVRNGLLVGVTVGLSVVSKLSAFVFLPACAVAFVIARWLVNRKLPPAVEGGGPPPFDVRRAVTSVVAGGAVAFLVVWAVFRFSVGQRFGSLIPGGISLPLPELVDGVRQLTAHSEHGHSAFLLGQHGRAGWWYFFPFGIAVKTPIPFLILMVIGSIVAVRTARTRVDWRYIAPLAGAMAVLGVAMTSSINIGVRHVLPFFPLMAITASIGAVWLWNLTRQPMATRGVVGVLIAWQVGASARAHPDYLPYFNELAGRHPERLLRDSDLDWGQDLLRLADTVRARGIDTLSIAYFGQAELARILPTAVHQFTAAERPVGWVAISEQWLSHSDPQLAGYAWLRAIDPAARVGKSIKLYHVARPATP